MRVKVLWLYDNRFESKAVKNLSVNEEEADAPWYSAYETGARCSIRNGETVTWRPYPLPKPTAIFWESSIVAPLLVGVTLHCILYDV